MKTRLGRIERMSLESPEAALDSLANIDHTLLSSPDKHYYDFLMVKVADKAYVTHTSDSLILKVIDHEQSRRGNGRYAEALYYGGRVYSDLGDFPSALNYYQKALDAADDQPSNPDLKANILSQYGRMLTSMRLYKQAIPYIKSSIDIGKQNLDTVNVVYDLQLLGGTYLRASNYGEAEHAFKEAMELSRRLPAFHSAKSMMYLAEIKSREGHFDSALSLIREIPDKVKPTVRETALGYAADIYMKAGIFDTAYIYAQELIHSPKPAPREIGYQVLLSPELRGMMTQDSIDQYISDYRSLLEGFYDENEMRLAINQENQFNYLLHQREKEKAEKSKENLKYLSFILSLVIALLTIGILLLKNRNKTQRFQLHCALENINRLNEQLSASKPLPSAAESADVPADPVAANETPESQPMPISGEKSVAEMREELKNKLMLIYEQAAHKVEISPIILKSAVYGKLQRHIAESNPPSDKFWKDLEKTILKSSPNFKSNLNLLTSGSLTTLEYQTALLVKCGISPGKMKSLYGRSHGAISSRRELMCEKALGEKLGTKVIDAIIRLL